MKLLTIVVAAFVSACMATGYQRYQGNGGGYDQTGYTQGYAATSPTTTATAATYINGVALTIDEKGQLEQLIGYVLPAGRYHIDAQYNFAREGEAPFDNLGRLAQANSSGGNQGESGRAWSMHSRDASGQGSTLVDDGNGCMIMSTPSGSISTGC